MRRAFIGAVLGSITILYACGGQTSSSQGDTTKTSTADGGSADGSSADAHAATIPSQHRATASTCAPTSVGAEPDTSGVMDAGALACSKNEDCTAKAGGRCIYISGQCGEPCQQMSPHTVCEYDECATDKDCPAAATCACGMGGASTNACTVPGNCRTDADCASGYCSPSVDGCGTFNGYFCHTPSDSCNDDSDCTSGGLFEKCVTNGTSPTWACNNVGCASAGGSAP